MQRINEIWMAVFPDEKSGDDTLLTYEIVNPHYPGTTMVVPAMSVSEKRMLKLLPGWIESAKRIGVEIRVLHFKREDNDTISDYAATGQIGLGGEYEDN